MTGAADARGQLRRRDPRAHRRPGRVAVEPRRRAAARASRRAPRPRVGATRSCSRASAGPSTSRPSAPRVRLVPAGAISARGHGQRHARRASSSRCPRAAASTSRPARDARRGHGRRARPRARPQTSAGRLAGTLGGGGNAVTLTADARRRARCSGAAEVAQKTPVATRDASVAVARFLTLARDVAVAISSPVDSRRRENSLLRSRSALPVDSRPSHPGPHEHPRRLLDPDPDVDPRLPLWRRGKVRDVYDLGDRLLDRRHRPHQRLRRRAAHAASPARAWCSRSSRSSGSACSPDVVPEPRGHRRRGRVSAPSCRRVPRPARGPLDARAQDGAASRRVRGARLPRRLGLEGLPERRARSAASRCRPGCASRTGSSRRSSRPSTKAETGHDENISFEQMVGASWAPAARRELRDLTLEIYRRARAHAEARGIILADTKFEFGLQRRARGLDRRGAAPPTRRASGRATPTSPAARSPASTSSTCATTSRPWTGTSVRRVPPCRKTS